MESRTGCTVLRSEPALIPHQVNRVPREPSFGLQPGTFPQAVRRLPSTVPTAGRQDPAPVWRTPHGLLDG
jgi:hypothetical protein